MTENNETMRLQYAVHPADNIQITLHRKKQEKTDYERWSYNIFNNMYCGNCITMNSLHYNSKFDLGQGNGEQKDAISKYQVTIIHEPYTQPVFDLSNIIRLPVSVETYVAVTKACMTNGLQNLTMKYCKCQIPWFHSYSKLPVCKGHYYHME
ncbi:hypothetical protein CHUAL_013502 [Chamberlinius hualienensis]